VLTHSPFLFFSQNYWISRFSPIDFFLPFFLSQMNVPQRVLATPPFFLLPFFLLFGTGLFSSQIHVLVPRPLFNFSVFD